MDTTVTPAVAPAPPDTHQLDKLPDLPPETPFYRDSRLWLVVLFFISTAGVIAICGYFKLDAIVSNSFVSANATLHTLTAGMIGADKMARKGVYALAANKDGIKTDQTT